MSSTRLIILWIAMGVLVLALSAVAGACESASVSTDSCAGPCSGTTQCAAVCPCDGGDCTMFECVNISQGGEYLLPDGAPIQSCSIP